MPTLTRLVIVLLFISIVVYAAILGLATWVRPAMTQITVDIPPARVQPRPWPLEKNAQPPGPAGQPDAPSGGWALP